MKANLLLVLASMCLSVLAAEGLARLFDGGDAERVEIVKKNLYNSIPDKRLGSKLKPNNTYRAQKYAVVKGVHKLIYDVTYTADGDSRRTVRHEVIQDAPHVLLFGGSFMWGEGLSDEQTLQHQLKLQMPHVNVFNYAMHGKGTTHMLSLFESEGFSDSLPLSNGVAIYGYLWFHEGRNTCSVRQFWNYKGPFYELDHRGNLVTRGNCVESRPVLMNLNLWLSRLQRRSRLASMIDVDFAEWFIDPVQLTAQLIIASKRRYEEMFDGEFLVLDHPANSTLPDDERSSYQYVLDQLRKNGVRVIRLPIETGEASRLSPYDGHPSALLNREIAEQLAKTERMRGIAVTRSR